MTDPVHGGYTLPRALHLLDRVCGAAGLDPRGAILLRGQTNAVFRLAAHPVVVKIARVGTGTEEVRRTVLFVRWLMDRGFPTVPLYRPELQPVLVGGESATLWRYLPQPPQAVPAEALAKPLSTLHSLASPPVALGPLDVCAAVRSSLNGTAILDDGDLGFLRERADALEGALRGVTYELPEGILQGDPQHGNALHDGDGAVLCDWDNVCTGQPEWDLATIEVHCRRFGYGAEHYRRFAETYGWDVTAWSGHPVLRDLRELRMVATMRSSRRSRRTGCPDQAVTSQP
ncbi:phosphotransferase [Streptomyces sp. SBT349]|uniref:phosphotransferase n=1 Tax=Streptomyces sp. SBT349 TaxID=1580539 RepID=UPI00066D5ED8|nr:phosphotransferase [Streptomyces sp. SBT349]